MDRYNELMQAAVAARAANGPKEDAEWVAGLCDHLSSFLSLPLNSLFAMREDDNGDLVSGGSPLLVVADGWTEFIVGISADPDKKFVFQLHIGFQKRHSQRVARLGRRGQEFRIPPDLDKFFTHVFERMKASLETNEGMKVAREGGVLPVT